MLADSSTSTGWWGKSMKIAQKKRQGRRHKVPSGLAGWLGIASTLSILQVDYVLQVTVATFAV